MQSDFFSRATLVVVVAVAAVAWGGWKPLSLEASLDGFLPSSPGFLQP